MLNVDELLIEKIRFATAHDIATNKLLYRLTQLEDPTLATSAESEDVTDAKGVPITTFYRAKSATFSATNSLFSLGLAAEQYGAKKEIAGLADYTFGNAADANATLTDYTYEIKDVPTTGDIELAHKASNEIQYIYSIENNSIGTMYKAGTAASATEFVVDNTGSKTIITPPTGLTGKIFVEYQYTTDSAVKVTNKASEFPRAVNLIIYVLFRDVCNENLVYSGKIICPKAKLDPTSSEIAFTSTGKHAFTFNLAKDYCSTDEELFTILVSNE